VAASVEATHSGDYCTWKVRSRWSGFTRIPSADPLLALKPSEVFPFEPWLHDETKPPLMGFLTTPSKLVIVIALQSFKELKGR
jgi:hypothetical protein